MNTLRRYVSGSRLILLALAVETIWYVIMISHILNLEDAGHRDVGGYLFVALLLFSIIATAARGVLKHVYWMYYTMVAGGFLLLLWIIGLAIDFYLFATPIGALLLIGGGLLALKENEKNPV